MKSIEQRITKLENRVAHLEYLIRNSDTEQLKKVKVEVSGQIAESKSKEPKRVELGLERLQIAQAKIKDTRPIDPVNPEKAIGTTSMRYIPSSQEGTNWSKHIPNNQTEASSAKRIQSAPLRDNNHINDQDNSGKDREALVGKYIIGALAALLIFVAAISFVGLVWNKISPEFKLFIISFVGITLSAIGFRLVRKKKNPISSILLGIGAGLIFIAILSANLAFHMIGNEVSILLAGLWSVLFVVSSHYTNLFFTTIIAYIGSYLTLILGLILMQGSSELLLLVIFVSVIALVMIYTTGKKKRECLWTVILSILSYGTILVRCLGDGGLGAKQQLLTGYGIQIAVILIIYLLMNISYKLIDDTKASSIYLCISFPVTLLTMLFISYLGDYYLVINDLIMFILFFSINLLQFILNDLFYKRITSRLAGYYIAILVITTACINIELFDEPSGIILIGLLLLVRERVFKLEYRPYSLGLIMLLDTLFLWVSSSTSFMVSIFGLFQLGLMGYTLWRSTVLKRYTELMVIKTIGILVILANSNAIIHSIIRAMHQSEESILYGHAIGYFMVVIVLMVLIKLGYLKDWRNEGFEFFGKNDSLQDDNYFKILFYIISIGLYFCGVGGTLSAEGASLQLIFTLATIAIALTQTRLLLSGNNRNSTLTGIWIVIKYLILTWTLLGAFSSLEITSVVYSIAGLVVAILCILAGFKIRNRSIRLYGLVLTIIMVAKFILVDLNEENSLTRVVALIAGGGLCFLISLMYNKLNDNYS